MRVVMLIAVVVFLTACQATVEPKDPKVTIERDKITIESDDHGGKFCPPGHAKKGWC